MTPEGERELLKRLKAIHTCLMVLVFQSIAFFILFPGRDSYEPFTGAWFVGLIVCTVFAGWFCNTVLRAK